MLKTLKHLLLIFSSSYLDICGCVYLAHTHTIIIMKLSIIINIINLIINNNNLKTKKIIQANIDRKLRAKCHKKNVRIFARLENVLKSENLLFNVLHTYIYIVFYY